MISQDIFIKIGIISFFFIVGIGSGYWLGHDNEIEESSEFIIRHYSGIDIDLTPSSEEVDKDGK